MPVSPERTWRKQDKTGSSQNTAKAGSAKPPPAPRLPQLRTRPAPRSGPGGCGCAPWAGSHSGPGGVLWGLGVLCFLISALSSKLCCPLCDSSAHDKCTSWHFSVHMRYLSCKRHIKSGKFKTRRLPSIEYPTFPSHRLPLAASSSQNCITAVWLSWPASTGQLRPTVRAVLCQLANNAAHAGRACDVPALSQTQQ